MQLVKPIRRTVVLQDHDFRKSWHKAADLRAAQVTRERVAARTAKLVRRKPRGKK